MAETTDSNEMPLPDEITITGINARGHHGVLQSERDAGQEFTVDLTLGVFVGEAARGDDLYKTVNYAHVAEAVVEVVEGPAVNLIETVAERIAAVILENELVSHVRVTVHKPSAPIPVPFGGVAVTVNRSRSNPARVQRPFIENGAPAVNDLPSWADVDVVGTEPHQNTLESTESDIEVTAELESNAVPDNDALTAHDGDLKQDFEHEQDSEPKQDSGFKQDFEGEQDSDGSFYPDLAAEVSDSTATEYVEDSEPIASPVAMPIVTPFGAGAVAVSPVSSAFESPQLPESSQGSETHVEYDSHDSTQTQPDHSPHSAHDVEPAEHAQQEAVQNEPATEAIAIAEPVFDEPVLDEPVLDASELDESATEQAVPNESVLDAPALDEHSTMQTAESFGAVATDQESATDLVAEFASEPETTESTEVGLETPAAVLENSGAEAHSSAFDLGREPANNAVAGPTLSQLMGWTDDGPLDLSKPLFEQSDTAQLPPLPKPFFTPTTPPEASTEAVQPIVAPQAPEEHVEDHNLAHDDLDDATRQFAPIVDAEPVADEQSLADVGPVAEFQPADEPQPVDETQPAVESEPAVHPESAEFVDEQPDLSEQPKFTEQTELTGQAEPANLPEPEQFADSEHAVVEDQPDFIAPAEPQSASEYVEAPQPDPEVTLLMERINRQIEIALGETPAEELDAESPAEALPTFEPEQGFEPEPTHEPEQGFEPEPTHEPEQGFEPEPALAGEDHDPFNSYAVTQAIPVVDSADAALEATFTRGGTAIFEPDPSLRAAAPHAEASSGNGVFATLDIMDELPSEPVRVVLAIGANLGDAQGTLNAAVNALRDTEGFTITTVGPLARTAAVGGVEQPDFLNSVVIGTTTMSPRQLLHTTQAIELDHHRTREVHWGPRTLDIDVINYGQLVGTTDDLELPHPRAKERAFVLVPWDHADPDAYLPGLGGGPVSALAATAPDREGIRWLALDWLTK